MNAKTAKGSKQDLSVVRGDRMYAAVSNVGLCAFDVSDPTDPVQLGVFPIPAGTHMRGIDADENGLVALSRRGHGFALLQTCPPCYADCDASGVLDVFDFICFQDAFVGGDPRACDCDTSTGSGVCDVFDFLCFQDAFVAGCP